jgi:RNA methyltransferase, TrmH family
MTGTGLVDRFRSARRKDDVAILEGFHAIKHAIRFGAHLREVVSTDPDHVRRLAELLAPDVWSVLKDQVKLIDDAAFSKLTDPRPPTRIIAIADRPAVGVDELLRRPGSGPVVLLEDPRHLNNVGAAIRVSAAAGAEAVVTTGDANPWHPAAIRGAAGLHYALPVGRLSSPQSIWRPVLALDPEGQPLDPGLIPPGAVLAFGSERRGLTDALLARAETRIALPMTAGVSSLNLATSVAAVLYAIRFRSSESRERPVVALDGFVSRLP